MIFRNNLQRFGLQLVGGVLVLLLSGVVTAAQTAGGSETLTPVAIQSDLEKTVVSHILKKTPSLTSSNIVYKLQNAHQLQIIPARSDRYQFQISPKASLIGQTIVPCVFYDRHDAEVKRVLLYVDVDWVGPVVIADRLMRKGELIASADLRVETRSLQGEPTRHLSSLDDAVGNEVAVTVPEGATLTTWTVKPRPVIRRGEKIFLLTDRSNVQLKVRGLALEDGVVGQEIRVRTLLGKSKIMRGKVKNHETVQIRLLY